MDTMSRDFVNTSSDIGVHMYVDIVSRDFMGTLIYRGTHVHVCRLP